MGVLVRICATSDALLVALGVAGAQFLTSTLPGFQSVMLWGGVAFLLVYGALRFRAAFKGGVALVPMASDPVPMRRVVAIWLAFT
ncbi:L-lysine exporter family protein LysE/ArgO [Roseinatronobacter bogoriensis subsp. barguzinensis]|nr:L-lysine exporter family protein LysE/ArgO [Rhodobaca bogoriensis DSM 18756]TDW38548.1 L-lysine exporter family protein LysE/ArgO [Rhodobaca barguzinensis]TDY69412.1 LysE type translocator [Rhodobaca bogoriensis DSM 18756]